MEGCQPDRRSRSDSPVNRKSSSSSASACPVLSSVQDRHGRQHVKFGRRGDLHVFSRAMKYLKTSPMTHVNDLHYLLSTARVAGDKKAVLLVSDNGLESQVSPDISLSGPSLEGLAVGRSGPDYIYSRPLQI